MVHCKAPAEWFDFYAGLASFTGKREHIQVSFELPFWFVWLFEVYESWNF